ncbi:hypothetical protein ACLUV9_10620 [Limosilactobacillus balticus]|uniref:hypothetical protein n=1 Tax=Limosilactobacillus balticus TaxID=2759747 RepID=UPI0039934173
MKKKAIWITIIVLSVLFVFQIPFNLHHNAYYYATHTQQQKNRYLFVTLLDSNYLPASYVPGYNVENDDKRGSYTVSINKKRIHTEQDIVELNGAHIRYSKDYNDPNYYLNNLASFSFSENGVINEYYKIGNPPKNAKQEMKHALEQIQSEIKQNSEKPLINIQWLWNLWFSLPSKYR